MSFDNLARRLVEVVTQHGKDTVPTNRLLGLKSSLRLLGSILIFELVRGSKHVVELLLHVHVLVTHAHVVDQHWVGVLERSIPRLVPKHIIERSLPVPVTILIEDFIIRESSVLGQDHGTDESARALAGYHLMLT